MRQRRTRADMAIVPGRSALRGDRAGLCIPRLSKESLDVVYKQRIQSVCDLFSVGVFKSTFERNPEW